MGKKKRLHSANDAKAWKCRKCGTVNHPTKHHFFKLPAFHCSNKDCGKEFRGNFKFCLGEIKAEGKSLIGEVLDQRKTTYCVAYAYAKAVEITERICKVINAEDPDSVTPGNPLNLQHRFESKFPEVPSDESLTKEFGLHRVLHIGLMLRSEGITKEDPDVPYTVGDVSTIPRDDFEKICRCLADGYPMVSTSLAGNRRNELRYCQIYKAPPLSRFLEKKSKQIGHAFVIIGAGVKNGNRFFYYLNSWGNVFCPRKNSEGEIMAGGIGKLRETDLTKNLVVLLRPSEAGGERRLEDQSEFKITNLNYILMTAKTNQYAKLRVGSLRKKFENYRDDNLHGDIFRDDEKASFSTFNPEEEESNQYDYMFSPDYYGPGHRSSLGCEHIKQTTSGVASSREESGRRFLGFPHELGALGGWVLPGNVRRKESSARLGKLSGNVRQKQSSARLGRSSVYGQHLRKRGGLNR